MKYLQTTSDIKGRLIKFKLPFSDSIMSIHEGVVNSIQANATKIELVISRKEEECLDGSTKEKIESITIIDNGDGFTKDNFESFQKIDSTYKLEKGGKGIGRLSWLKVFEKVEIESTFREDGHYYYKKMHFSLYPNHEIGIEVEQESEKRELLTKIKLMKIKDEYYRNFPKQVDTIGKKILHHCLIYFMTKDNFDIIIKDSISQISLRKIYDETIKGKKRTKDLKIRELDFTLNFLTLDESHVKDKGHKLKFTANEREVQEVNLKEHNPMFDESFNNEYILAYIEGKYLDENVTDDRTGFLFATGNLFLQLKEIGEKVTDELKNIYTEEFSEIKNKNLIRMEEFLKENPTYRYIFSADRGIIEKMNHKISDEKIEDIFYNQSRVIKKDINNKIKLFSFEGDYKKEFEELSQQIQLINEHELSQYVLHRKIILSLLEKIISKKNSDETYYLEEDLHKLIFPMKTTGDKIDYLNHNLWLIDDRLSYYNFLSSDLPFNKITDNDDLTRPDLAIYRVAFSDRDNYQKQDNITIVEFKKPDRTADIDYYSIKKQVMSYRDKFLQGKIKTENNGRLVQTERNRTKFHIYVICELTEKLKNDLKSESFAESLDGMGMFRYYSSDSTLLEVISFDKLYTDAVDRNKVYFKKLGIE